MRIYEMYHERHHFIYIFVLCLTNNIILVYGRNGQDLFAPTFHPSIHFTLIKTPINNSQLILSRVVVTERLLALNRHLTCLVTSVMKDLVTCDKASLLACLNPF